MRNTDTTTVNFQAQFSIILAQNLDMIVHAYVQDEQQNQTSRQR
jgi:predicted ATPase with chaperone activity